MTEISIPLDGVTINVDFDGVLYNFVKASCALYAAEYGLSDEKLYQQALDSNSWEFWKSWADTDEFWALVEGDVGSADGVIYRHGESYPGMIDLLNKWWEEGAYIRIVSRKNHSDTGRFYAQQRMYDFLKEQGLKFDPFFCIVKESYGKVDRTHNNDYRYAADIIIDDNPDVNAWAQEGKLNILFDQPWNSGNSYLADNLSINRVATADRIFDLIENTFGQVETEDTAAFTRDPELLDDPAEQAYEAVRLVYGARGRDYGHPYDDYTRTVGAFNALTGRDLSAWEAALLLLLVKLSRENHAHKRDNIVDAHGYLMVMERIRERMEQDG